MCCQFVVQQYIETVYRQNAEIKYYLFIVVKFLMFTAAYLFNRNAAEKLTRPIPRYSYYEANNTKSLVLDSFRSKVWCTLEREVKFGETVSYGKLASLSGSPKASQAVGSAMRNNPVSLIVPCHRVILSSGRSGNYAGGKMNDTKVWLLNHEKTFT